MNKYDRIKEILEMVVDRILPTSIIPVTSRIGASWTRECPYHGGKSKGNFMVSDTKKMFNCFNCGQAGNVINYYKDHICRENLSYTSCGLILAESHDIISLSEYESLTKKGLSSKDNEKIEKYFKAKEGKKEVGVPKADDKVLDTVYKLFAQAITYMGKEELSEVHLNYLNSRCPEKQIKDVGYFTMPTNHIRKPFFKLLEENGIDKDILVHIPGFYYDKTKGDYFFAFGKGIGIPIPNELGLITGIQRRFDNVAEGENRYRWFSSLFPDDDTKIGCSSGVPMETIIPDVIKNKTLFITEGHFKARRIASTYGSIVLSVGGVQSWRKAVEVVENIKKMYGIQHVYIVFDSDMSSNIGVLNTALNLGNALYHSVVNGNKNIIEEVDSANDIKAPNPNLKRTVFVDKKAVEPKIETSINKNNTFVTFLLWDVCLGKGFDDLLENGHTAQNDVDKVLLCDMIDYSYSFMKALVEKNSEILLAQYNETEISYKEVSVKSINAIRQKYWKLLREIPNEDMELLFEDMILSKLPNYIKRNS